MLLTQSVVQLAERDTLLTTLPAAGIPVLPVKGCWLKEQYPDIDYRQMSDLDMLIREEDASKARTIMEQWGYSWEEDLVENHDSFKKPPYMSVELHRSLLPETDSHFSYYVNIWEKAQPSRDFPGVFRLKAEDEYIYYMVHLYKHLLHAGTGIRSFLDCMIYRTIYPDMDRAYLNRELANLHLDSFSLCVEAITDCWFSSGAPLPEDMQEMAKSILSAGTYGTVSQQIHNEMQQVRGNFRNPLAVKTVYLFRILFLPLKGMQELYPVLKKLPILLPLFWVWRPISRLLFGRDRLKQFLRNTDKEGDKLWSEFDWREFQSK
jgi:hypothetical protein